MSFFNICSKEISECVKRCSKGPSHELRSNQKGLFKSYRTLGNIKKVPEPIFKYNKKSIKEGKSLQKKTPFSKKQQKPQLFGKKEVHKDQRNLRRNHLATEIYPTIYSSARYQPQKMSHKTEVISNHQSQSFSGFSPRVGDRYFGYKQPNKEIREMSPSLKRVTFSFGKEKVNPVEANIQSQQTPKGKNHQQKSLEKHSTSPSEILYCPLKRITNSRKETQRPPQHNPSITQQKQSSHFSKKQPQEFHPKFLPEDNPRKNLKKKSDFFLGKKAEHGHTRYNSQIFWKTNRPEYFSNHFNMKEENISQSYESQSQNQQSPEIHINLVQKLENEQSPIRIRQEEELNQDDQIKFNLSVCGANNLDELDFCRKTQSIHESNSEKDHFSDLVSLNSIGNKSDQLTKLLKIPKKQKDLRSKSTIRNKGSQNELYFI